MKIIAVIPARYAATRLPGKPLADILGKPMVQWVYERAAKARGIDAVYVATDDARIETAVRAFGGNCLLTSPDLQSGTDRVAAVADEVPGDIFLNVQGDEPLIEPLTIEKTLELVRSGKFPLGSAMTPLKSREELENRSVVKVLTDCDDRAIYFSRFPIPYGRMEPPDSAREYVPFRHLGLYVYRRETLEKFRALPPCPLEKAESLEQLRALYHGIPIGLATVESRSIGVDTPEDLAAIRTLAQSGTA